MKPLKSTGFAEGLSTFAFLIEYSYWNIVRLSASGISFQAVSAEMLRSTVSSMLTVVLLASFMGHRLIYQYGWTDTRKPVMRKYGFVWFFLFYGLHLVFSCFFDVWFLFICNGRWFGLLLFLIKLAAVLYFGTVLRKAQVRIPTPESRQANMPALAPPGDRWNVFGVAGLFALMAVDVCFITMDTFLYNVVEFSELGILVLLFFGCKEKDEQDKKTISTT